MWNEDEVKGKGKQIKGDIKKTVGEWTGDCELEKEGKADRIEGEFQETVGEARRKAGEKVEELGKKIAGK